jgi:cytochrome c-type biogenesis protein CcmF
VSVAILVGIARFGLMVLASLGAGCLMLALLLVVASGVTAFFAGWRERPRAARMARRLFYGAAGALLAASAALLAALLTHDFSIAFVTEHTDRSMPAPLVAAAFYAGQEGSLLYWTLLLTLLGSAAVAAAAAAAGADVRLAAYANGCLAAVACFFLVVLVFVASPFDVLRVTPADGLGLNPVLRDGGMLIHPPFLLAGFSSFAIPFAFAMAALLAGRSDGAWIERTRSFALLSWGLQSVGLTLGMWWAYHVLGWGGYWGWDPVENVALMPWLVTTAYLHSAQVQERRGQLRAWNLTLVIAAFLLSVFGTFIVRSGILPSVHTFAVSPLGPWFLGFLAAAVLLSGAVLAWRSQELAVRQPLQPSVSREGAFLLQNVLLAALTAAILWGTVLPLLTGMLGRQLVVGPSYYERVAAPLLVAILALLALGPLLPWRHRGKSWLRNLRPAFAAAALTLAVLLLLGAGAGALVALPLIAAGLATALSEYVRGGLRAGRLAGPWPLAAARLATRRRRRYGAFLAHLGILLVAAGIVGSHFWQQERDVTLRPGQSVSVAGHLLSLQSVDSQEIGDHSETVAVLRLGGEETLAPARLNYPALGGQALSRVAIRSTAREDVYVVVAGTSQDGVALHVFVNPLVTWIWAGAALLVVGVLIGHLGRSQPAPDPARLTARVPAVAP